MFRRLSAAEMTKDATRHVNDAANGALLTCHGLRKQNGALWYPMEAGMEARRSARLRPSPRKCSRNL